MDDLFMFFPIIIIAIFGFFAVPLIKMFTGVFGESNTAQKQSKDARYDRQVHQMHTKDASSERKHRLDQLKSLYEAGMMEKDEYLERVESVEADYRGRY
ncbi:MAG: hypothetical protein IIW81_05900 [Oscillospiraceae bacterium]|nr:hypothetical protein [Oscillospiraceae bacterium]MBQ5897980.1 hypothetical protein [Oscillospiraceae bacterium]